MPRQLFLQHPAGLDEEAAIDGLGRHAHSLVVGIGLHKPARDLLGGPLEGELRGDDPSQAAVAGKETGLGATRGIPGALVGQSGTIARRSAGAGGLTADGRGGASERAGDGTQRPPLRETARDLLAFEERERSETSCARPWEEAAGGADDEVDRAELLLERASDRPEGLTGSPALPQLPLLRRRQTRSPHLCHVDPSRSAPASSMRCADGLDPPRNARGKTVPVLEGHEDAFFGLNEAARLVAPIARQHVYVVMRNALSSGDPVVLEHVEAGRLDRSCDGTGDALRVAHRRAQLVRREIKDRRCMPFEDHEDVSGAKRLRADEGQCLLKVLDDRPLACPLTTPGEVLAERARPPVGHLE